MKISQYVKRLEAQREAVEKKQAELGEKFRQEVLIPFCRKYRLEYINAMGMFFFVKTLKKYQNGEVVSQTGYEDDDRGCWGDERLRAFFERCDEYQEIKEVLETNTVVNFEFGFSVNEVRKEDL
jgi:hypothetical protein